MQVFRALSALILIGASASSLAEETTSGSGMVLSNLVFSIDRTDLGIFPLALETGSDSALSYNLADGVVEMNLADPTTGRYLNPLFCFDFNSNGNIALRARDANGSLIIGDTPLGLDLSYIINNNEINYRPPAGVQCFYRGSVSGQFGLFGRPPQPLDEAPEGRIFADRFETDDRISIEYVNLAPFRNPGEALSYQIVLTNTGSSSLSNVAFQELAPTSAENFDASVTPVPTDFWSCNSAGGAQCPGASQDPNSLRFSDLSLPVGSSLTFNLNRVVRGSSESGKRIDFHAGVVAGGNNGAAYDTATGEVVVIGTADSVYAGSDGAMAGEIATIEVTVLDSDLNPVPFVNVDLIDGNGLQINPTSAQTSDQTGFAQFQASATQAGEYLPQFAAAGAGSATASVIITAAAPYSVDVVASVPEAVADGDEEVVFEVTVKDIYANPVASSLVEVDDPDGLNDISSADPWTDSTGAAIFTASSTSVGSHTVSFGSGPATPGSATVEFIAGQPEGITFFQHPSDVPAGELMVPPVVIHIVDAAGNHVTSDDSSIVQLWLRQNGSVVDFNFAVATAIGGEVVFDQLSLSDPGEGYDFWAQAALSGGASDNQTSDLFEVLPAP